MTGASRAGVVCHPGVPWPARDELVDLLSTSQCHVEGMDPSVMLLVGQC